MDNYGIGLDIGTTSVCGIVTDAVGKVIHSITRQNTAHIKSTLCYERLQDADVIADMCKSIYDELRGYCPQFSHVTVGVTGQMHGIVYTDSDGRAVSPLYTWQDGRGDLPFGDGMSYVAHLGAMTGYRVATGYGMVTHYYNLLGGVVPLDATKLSTIQDYVVMRLGGLKEPMIHYSNAASLGLFDIAGGNFDAVALSKAGIDSSMLPTVCGERIVGVTSRGDRVMTAVGDNQTSVYGAAGLANALVCNIGTGAQISVISDRPTDVKGSDLELRPYIGGKYLIAGCSLCGGYSYGLLKDFFKDIIERFGIDKPSGEIYAVMNELASTHVTEGNNPEFCTTFKGTRSDPTKRATVTGLSDANFTPGHLCAALLRGVCDELYGMWLKVPDEVRGGIEHMYGSGNGLKCNSVLRSIIESRFGMSLELTSVTEDAAYGTALIATTMSGIDGGIAKLD